MYDHPDHTIGRFYSHSLNNTSNHMAQHLQQQQRYPPHLFPQHRFRKKVFVDHSPQHHMLFLLASQFDTQSRCWAGTQSE
jgi:hypothetical protein